jgi:hypothetical protein
MYQKASTVALLLKAGAEVDKENNNGVTPLMAAARDGYAQQAPQACDGEEVTATAGAACHNWLCTSLAKASTNAAAVQRGTGRALVLSTGYQSLIPSFLMAVFCRYTEVVQLLLAGGADYAQVDEFGRTVCLIPPSTPLSSSALPPSSPPSMTLQYICQPALYSSCPSFITHVLCGA